MKVKIGKHIDWIGPYQISSMLFACVPKVKDKNGFYEEREFIHTFGRWLAEDKNGNDSWLAKVCQKIHDRRKRKISVKVHEYDAWNADHTLALIILPVLTQLASDTHGAPYVEDSDVPIWLHSTLKPGKEKWDSDGHFHDRWEWVLNEMIWAFNEKAYGSDSKFYDHGEVSDSDSLRVRAKKMKVDHVGLDAYHKRMQNGFRLFGKYYQNLWS